MEALILEGHGFKLSLQGERREEEVTHRGCEYSYDETGCVWSGAGKVECFESHQERYFLFSTAWIRGRRLVFKDAILNAGFCPGVGERSYGISRLGNRVFDQKTIVDDICRKICRDIDEAHEKKPGLPFAEIGMPTFDIGEMVRSGALTDVHGQSHIKLEPVY